MTINYDAINDALFTLNKLADDFDSLSDISARDDSVFIYKWKPPSWSMNGCLVKRHIRPAERVETTQETDRRRDYRAQVDECIEISATLRWTVTQLKDLLA